MALSQTIQDIKQMNSSDKFESATMRYTNYYIPLHESLFFIDGFFSSCSFSLIIHLVLSLYSSILFFLFLLFFINPFLILLGQIYFLYLHDLIPFFIYISLYFLGIKVFYLHVSCFFLLFSSISSFFNYIYIFSFGTQASYELYYIVLLTAYSCQVHGEDFRKMHLF